MAEPKTDTKCEKEHLDKKKDIVAEKLEKWQAEKGRLKVRQQPWEPPRRLTIIRSKKLQEQTEKENTMVDENSVHSTSYQSNKNKSRISESHSTATAQDRKRLADISLSQDGSKRARLDSCGSGDKLNEIFEDSHPPTRRDLLDRWREGRRAHYAARLQARAKANAERRKTLASQTGTVAAVLDKDTKRRQTVNFASSSVKTGAEPKTCKPEVSIKAKINEPKKDKAICAGNQKKPTLNGQKKTIVTENITSKHIATAKAGNATNKPQPKTLNPSKAAWVNKPNHFKNATSKIDTGLRKSQTVKMPEKATENTSSENSTVTSKAGITSAIPPKVNSKKSSVVSKKGVSIVSTKSPKKFSELSKRNHSVHTESGKPKKRTSISSLYRKGVKTDKINKITSSIPEEHQKEEEKEDLNTTITIDDELNQEDENVPDTSVTDEPDNSERPNSDQKSTKQTISRPYIDSSNDGSFLLNDSNQTSSDSKKSEDYNLEGSIKKTPSKEKQLGSRCFTPNNTRLKNFNFQSSSKKTPINERSFTIDDNTLSHNKLRLSSSSSCGRFQQNSGFKSSVKKTPVKGILSYSKRKDLKTPFEEDKENISFPKSCGRSVSFVIPFQQTPKREVSNREKLLQWLESRGKTLNDFRHLHCFGLHLSTRKDPNKPTLKKNSVPVTKTEDIVPGPVEWNWDASPELNMPGSRITPVNQSEDNEADAFDIEEILFELSKLTDSDYPYQYISEWLDELCEYSPTIQKKACYWILRIKITQKSGFIRDIQQLLKHAMEHQAEPIHDLVKMMQEITLNEDDTSFEDSESVGNTPANTSRRVVVDSSNIFGSSVRRYSLTPAVKKGVKNSTKKLSHYVATPVRRSARHPLSSLSKSEVPVCIESIEELPAGVRRNVLYKNNPALRDWEPQMAS